MDIPVLFPRSKTSTKRDISVPSSPSNNSAHISTKPSPSEAVNSDWEKPTVTPIRIITKQCSWTLAAIQL